MGTVIVDARQWQNLFDLESGRKVSDESATVNMVRGVLERHPYPGDLESLSNRWVTETALDLIRAYAPSLVCLSYAQQYFMQRFTPLDEDALKRLFDGVFEEAVRFIDASGFTPVFVGTGDLVEPAGETDLSGLDGLALGSGWSARYAGLHQPTARDLDYVASQPGVERLVSREEWGALFAGVPHAPERLPDYLVVGRPGWTFRTLGSMLRRSVRLPGVDTALPLATSLGAAPDLTGVRALVEEGLKRDRVALIVIEGVGSTHFALPHMPCSNHVGWYTYEPGEAQYLTLTTGTHQVFAYPAGYRYDEEDDELKGYPFSGYFREVPGHTLGADCGGRSIAVGNRSMFTHMVFGADISVECFARNLFNQGGMAVIQRGG